MINTIKTIWRFFAIAILFSFSTALIAQNSSPVFNSDPQLLAVPDFEYKYGVSVFDPDGDAVTLSSTGLPAWLTLEEMSSPEYISSGRYRPGIDGMQVIDVAPDGKVWVWNNNYQTIVKMNSDGSDQEDVITNASTIEHMSIASDGTVYMIGYSEGWSVYGLQRLRPDSTNFELMNSDIGCSSPLAIAADGSVWRVDECYNAIRHYAADTSTFEQFDNLGLSNPKGIAFHPDGTLWITENNWEGSIHQFDPSDTTITTLVENAGGELNYGRYIEIDENGSVVTLMNGRVYHLNDSLEFVQLSGDYVERICSNPAIGEVIACTWSEMWHFTPVYDFLHGTPSVSDHGEQSISIVADDGQGNTSSQDFTLMVDSTVVFYSVQFGSGGDENDSIMTNPANWDYVSEDVVLGWSTDFCTCDGCNEIALINYQVETCLSWGDWEDRIGSPLGTLWTRETSTDSANINEYYPGDYWMLRDAASEGRSISMWDRTENKMYDIQPLGTWPESYQYENKTVSYYRIPKGDGFIVNPNIVSIADVPEDQGGRVYVTFVQSAWDTDELPGRSTESYTIQRKDGDTWVGLTSVGAYGSDEYVVEVSTLNDSDSDGNNEADFRVIANMDEGNFVSAAASGFSSDNIAPDAPDDLGGQIVEGSAELQWAASTANDLGHYNVYRGATEDFVHNDDSFIGESETSDYVDAAMATGDNFYIVTAVDVHDNESDASAAVSLTSMFVDGGAGVPDVFALHQNYPNPFNPITNIRFDVPENSMVTMAIYDLLGHKVRTLINYEMNAGFHSIKWNGTNDHGNPLASGMYIYRINAGGFHAVKKLVFMK